MLTKKILRFQIAFFLVLGIAGITIMAAFAEGNSPQSSSNFAGITTAIASKNAFKYQGGQYYLFQCDSFSYTSPGTAITTIGYTWFACYVYRDGIYVAGFNRSGSVNYNASSHVDSGTLIVFPASSSRVVTGEGTHDFGHFDGTTHTWRPYVWRDNSYVP
ncbi:MAG: hypothetical protein KJ063_05440 [Anaerolineae bacterium]|nr:hypothetical protein [Anaerolineae bacterium]